MELDFTPEKLTQAREAGLSDGDIQTLLVKKDPRFGDAFSAGGTLDELAGYFAKKQQPAPDRSFAGALKQGIDAPLEAIGTTAEVFGLTRTGKALKGLVEAPVNYESAGNRVINPQPDDLTIGGFGVGSIPRAITEQLGQVAGSIITRAAGALAGRAIGGAIGGAAGSASGPGALASGAAGSMAGGAVGSFVAPFAFQAMQIAGPTALERAKNNGRTEPNKEDLAYGLTTAAASGALDALGAKYLPGGEKAVGGWVSKLSKAIFAETVTEGSQSVAEQAGGTLGTDAGLKISAKQAAGEAIIGGGAGGGISIATSGASSALEAVKPQAKAAVEEVNKTVAEVAAAEPPPVIPEAPPVISTPSVESTGQSEPLPVVTTEAPEGAAPEISAPTELEQMGSDLDKMQELHDSLPDGPEKTQLAAAWGKMYREYQELEKQTFPAEDQQQEQPEPSVDERIKSAYEEAVKESGFSDVQISDLQQRSGLPLEEVHSWLRDNISAKNIDPTEGDNVYTDEEQRSAALKSEDDPNVQYTKVKLKPEFRQQVKDPVKTPISRRIFRGRSNYSPAEDTSEKQELGPGKYWTDERDIAQYFTGGEDTSMVEEGDVTVETPLDFTSRDWRRTPQFKKLKELLESKLPAWTEKDERWMDIRNPYNVLSQAAGGKKKLNQKLREAGYDSIVSTGISGFGDLPLQVVQLPEFRQRAATATEPSVSTPETPGTGSEGDTEVQGAAAPQVASTEKLSAAQLEERITTVLGKRSSAKSEAEKNQYLEEARSLTEQLKIAEGESMGPGAAASTETLAEYAQRKFGVRFEEDPRIAPELKEAAGNRFYEVLPNKVTAAEASELIDQVGDDQAERMIRDDKSDASFAVRSTVGQIIIQRLNKQYQYLKETDPRKASQVLNRAADLAEWQQEFGTRLGQGVQSFAMWMRLTPEGKLMTIKKAVRKARERHKQINEKEVDEVVDVLGTDRTASEKTKEMERLGKKNKTARRVRKKLKQLTAKPQTEKTFYDIASKELGLPELTPEQEIDLLDLAAKVDLSADGLPKWEAADKFYKAANKIKGFTPLDFAFGYYYGNILSGAGTQIVNAVDTFLNVLHEANTLAAANPKAAATIYASLGRGVANSKADAVMALTKGRKVSNNQVVQAMGAMEDNKFGQKGGVSIIGQGKVDKLAKAILESKAAVPLNAWKYIGRLMSASDAVMFRGAQEARAGLLAYRLATEEGLTSSQRAKRVNEILGWDREEEFMQKAKEEGYTGNEQQARATELMLMQRPEGMQQDASEFAGLATYNSKPKGVLGDIARGLGNFSEKYPALRLVVPFTNIVANVFNRRLDNLPGVAIYRSKKGFYENEEAGKNAITRMAISMGMITALISLNATGALEITGPGPDDPEKKKQLKETGWRPYSIKIGKNYYSFANTPISLGLGVIGNMLDWSRYKKASKKADKAFIEATIYSVFGLGSYLASQSFISGLSNFFETFGGNTGKRDSSVRKFFSQTASSAAPMSAALKDIDSAFDDTARDSGTMGAAILAQIPFARYSGRPALNAFGDPIKTGRIRPLERFVHRENDKSAWTVIADKELRVPVPDPFFKNDADNYQYQKESGQMIKQWVLDNEDTLRGLASREAQLRLSDAASRHTERIRTKIKRQELERDAQGKN